MRQPLNLGWLWRMDELRISAEFGLPPFSPGQSLAEFRETLWREFGKLREEVWQDIRSGDDGQAKTKSFDDRGASV